MKLFKRNNLRRNISGVAALEFAILLPFLLILLYGTYTVAMSILISRKVDNAVNDLSFVISREPRIATGNVNVNGSGNITGCKTEGCTGGATKLNQIIDELMPVLLYPYSSNTKYAVMISYVGTPTNLPASLAPNTLRLMWSHQRGAVGASNANVSAQLGLENFCAPYQNTTTVNGVATTFSTFKEKYLANTQATDRASVVFPGQSFIVASIRFQSDGFGAPIAKGNKIPSGQSLFDSSNFLRNSTYAVRSSWQDVNNNKRVDSTEFFNEMHYCTDCSFKTSRQLDQQASVLANQSTDCSTGGAAKLQMRCVANPLILNPPAGNNAGSTNYYSSGCSFK